MIFDNRGWLRRMRLRNRAGSEQIQNIRLYQFVRQLESGVNLESCVGVDRPEGFRCLFKFAHGDVRPENLAPARPEDLARLPRDVKSFVDAYKYPVIFVDMFGDPVWSVRFLLAIAARLLPLERDRYLEEFRAELSDVPRNTQLRHTLSLLRGVFVLHLRRGLRNKAADAAARKAKE